MNAGRLFLTIVVAFIYIFASDFAIHALWLDADYKATASLWRPEEEIRIRFLWMLGAQLLCAVAFVYIWAKTGWRHRSIVAGASFGFWIGLVPTGHDHRALRHDADAGSARIEMVYRRAGAGGVAGRAGGCYLQAPQHAI